MHGGVRWALAGLVLLALAAAAAADVAGCEGFVRVAEALQSGGVDLSRVEVRLETEAGAVVEQTECAPNGYFFLPLYSARGALRIVVRGPSALHFEPEWHSAEVADGVCNGGAEAEFVVAGLAVSARVEAPHHCPPAAAEAAEVALVNAATGAVVGRTAADASGAVRLGPVAAGAYRLEGGGAAAAWAVQSVDVEAAVGGVQVAGPLRLAGLAVVGSVQSADGAAVADARLRLTQPSRPPQETLSDARGRFRFEGVACGACEVSAADERRLRLAPAVRSATVASGSAEVDAFVVVAFEAAVRVEDLAAAPVAGARLYVDGAEAATADGDGEVRWLAAAGPALLEARAAGLRFAAPTSLTLAPQEARLESLRAVAAAVDGHVEEGSGRVVRLDATDGGGGRGGTVDETRADGDGNFRLWAPRGRYVVTVEATAAEAAQGVRYEPAALEVDVAATAVAGLRLRRSALALAGSVACDGDCSGVRVRLEEAGGEAREVAVADDHSFRFAPVRPGRHVVRVVAADRCWAAEQREVDVEGRPVQLAEAFQQRGWAMQLELAAALALRATHEESGASEAVEAPAGRSHMCLPRAGVYLLEAEAGARFAEAQRYDTAAPRVVAPLLAALELRCTVVVAAAAAPLAPTVRLEVWHGTELAATLLQDAAAPLADSAVRLSFMVWVPTDDGAAAARPAPDVRLVPRAPELLFTPADVAAAAADARLALPAFQAARGVFLEGVVEPRQAGVEVVVSDAGGVRLLSATTAADGSYRAGPLPPAGRYQQEARLAGYSFAAIDGGFRAQRLGSLRVRVRDAAGAPLPHVLLSLTGDASFRRNSETDGTGEALAEDLAPGAYHLRPLLKEYSFAPASAAPAVAEGREALVDFVATRVAFSAFGGVRSLSGAAERLLTVVAETADGLREEAQTDGDGTFRLRGLLPGNSYRIAPAAAARVAAFLPPARDVTVGAADIEGLHFRSLRAPTRLDVSGVVHVPPAHLSSLTVTLYAGDERVDSMRLAALPVFAFTGLPKAAYRIEVTSDLASDVFAFAPVSAVVGSEVGATWLELSFAVEDRALTTVGHSSASFLLLLLLSAAAAAVLYRQQLSALAGGQKGAPRALASANDYIPAEQRRKPAAKPRRARK